MTRFHRAAIGVATAVTLARATPATASPAASSARRRGMNAIPNALRTIGHRARGCAA
jgi:hypothetical protein